MVLRYKSLGSQILVPLFGAPDRTDEDDAAWSKSMREWDSRKDVHIVVRLVNRSQFRRWAYAHDKIRADNRAAMLALNRDTQDAINGIGDIVLERGAEESDALMKTVIAEAVLSLSGVEIDGVPDEDFRDPSKLVELIEHTGLLSVVFTATLKAQNPERNEAFS